MIYRRKINNYSIKGTRSTWRVATGQGRGEYWERVSKWRLLRGDFCFRERRRCSSNLSESDLSDRSPVDDVGWYLLLLLLTLESLRAGGSGGGLESSGDCWTPRSNCFNWDVWDAAAAAAAAASALDASAHHLDEIAFNSWPDAGANSLVFSNGNNSTAAENVIKN